MLASCSDWLAVQKKACLLYFSCMGHFLLLSKSSTMSGKRRDVRGAMMAIEWSFSILAVTLVPIPIIIRHRDRERERGTRSRSDSNALKACDNAFLMSAIPSMASMWSQ